MKGILILLLSINIYGFNFYDISSTMNTIQNTLSDISYAKNTLNYITGSDSGISQNKMNMDYYRNPDNFNNINKESNIYNNRQIITQIFNDSDPQRLANKVNNFIQNREIIDIQFSVTSTVSEFYRQFGNYTTSNITYMYSALVVYRR